MYNIFMKYMQKDILILIGLIFIFIGFLFFNKTTAPQSLTAFEEIKNELSKLNKIEIKKESDFKWIKDDYSILIPATENFYINKQNSKITEFDEIPKIFEKEISIAEKILKERGYVFDIKNSSKNFSDHNFYDYIQSYKKGGDMCVIIVNPDNYQFNFSCSNSLDQKYTEQITFLEALELKGKNATIKIKNQKDNYYEVGIGYARTGQTAILKKSAQNEYRVLYIGQEAPSCKLINKENIPDEVLVSIGNGSCFDDDGNYIIKEN